MSSGSLGHRSLDSEGSSSFLPNTDFREINLDEGFVHPNGETEYFEEPRNEESGPGIFWGHSKQVPQNLVPGWKGLSPWSRSAAKRIFDFACVLLSIPIVLPLMVVIGATVRLTSAGPMFFLQKRVALHGRNFTIFKFRTMTHVAGAPHDSIASPHGRHFTPVGPFLRRWKLDELPQLINVLLGHMSLVGPRPKMREHVQFDLPCRPGITGMATTVFACEERILASIPKDHMETYFHTLILPTKRLLDVEYMARATFSSDFRILVNTVVRRWDTKALDEFIESTAHSLKDRAAQERMSAAADSVRRAQKQVVVRKNSMWA